MHTKPPVYSDPTPPRKKCLFGKTLTNIYVDRKLPAPKLDFIANIEGSLLTSDLYEN